MPSEGFVEKYQGLLRATASDFCGKYCEGVGRGCDADPAHLGSRKLPTTSRAVLYFNSVKKHKKHLAMFGQSVGVKEQNH